MTIAVKEMGLECMDWIHLAQDRDPVSGSCERGDEHSGTLKSHNVFIS
jgi:hypothetical protein